jgi:hypothetical protein
MADRWADARGGITERNFRSQTLDLLERIAVALERQSYPMYQVTSEEAPMGAVEEAGMEDDPYIQPFLHEKIEKIDHDPNALVCTCGNDWTKTCGMCSGARLAQVYQERNT